MAQIDPGIPLNRILRPALVPVDRILPVQDLAELLSNILLTSYLEERFDENTSLRIEAGFSVSAEYEFELPGLDGLTLVIGGARDTLFTAGAEVRRDATYEFSIGGVARMRFPREWFRPVVRESDSWVDDPNREFAELDIGAGIAVDQDWNVWFDGENEFSLGAVMIADTGIVVDGSLALDLSENSSLPETLAMGLGETWRGVIFKTLTIYLPDELNVPIAPESLRLNNFHIGSGGISGTISGNWNPAETRAEFFGVAIGLQEIQISFLQNSLTEFSIACELELPFFEQTLRPVELSVDLDGNWAISVASDDGLASLTLDNVLEVNLSGIGFAVENGLFEFIISGEIRLLIAGIEWPSFEVEELSIDSKGNVKIDGGWIDLRDQFSFSFYGFQMEVSRIGFGKEDDGSKWIGFSAAITFVDQLSLGGSVEGMRISWKDGPGGPTDIGVSVEGVGVLLEIPDVLKFGGQVRFVKEPFEGQEITIFRGDVALELYPIDLNIDASLAIGRLPPHGDIALYLYVGAELPFGILLGSTNIGLYGLAGLFAMNMAPNKQREEAWVGDLKIPEGEGTGWYTRTLPYSATAADRWGIQRDALGFGAGVTLGTYADNGYAVSARVLLVLSFPGPVIILEGRANILKERSSLGGEPAFVALAIIDGRAGTFLISIGARYAIDDSGALIEISASAEAFFDFSNPRNWHLYMGQKEPIERRIRSALLKLFESNSYFMLDHDGVELGAWVGYDGRWTFGPLEVILSCYIEGGAALTFKPIQFHGELHAHGELGLRVWKFGLRLMLDAGIVVDAPQPFEVCGRFSVEIDLPWPLPSFGATIELCWGGTNELPPLPLPVKEVAIGHELVGHLWRLPRQGAQPLLLPDWDIVGNEEADGLIHPDRLASPPSFGGDPSVNPDEIAVINRAPVVPLDARPSITFAKNVDNIAGIGNPSPASDGRDQVGDHTFYYQLLDVSLERLDGSTWVAMTPIYGAWSPVVNDEGETEASKLVLFAKSSFSFSRNVSSTYEEWLTEQYPNYPCPSPPQSVTRCFDLENMRPGLRLPNPWTHPDNEFVGFEQVPEPADFIVLDNDPDRVAGRAHAIELSGLSHTEFVISLPANVSDVELYLLVIDEGRGDRLTWTTVPDPNSSLQPRSGAIEFEKLDDVPRNRDSHRPLTLKIRVDGAVEIRITGTDVFFYGLCLVVNPSLRDWERYQERIDSLDNFRSVWEAEGNVLHPSSSYRITIETLVTDGDPSAPDRRAGITERAYFRTEGPPGLANLAASSSEEINDRISTNPLNDLRLYVDATLPTHGLKPVNRAYDLGVRFKDQIDYVELMYALAGRNLAMYLFDQNGEPIRDAEGALVTPRNAWTDPAIEQVTRRRSAARWRHTINQSNCWDGAPPDEPLPDQITTGTAGQTLQAGTFHEVRLIPMLMYESFEAELLNPDWQVIDPPNPSGAASSNWQLDVDAQTDERFVIQTAAIFGGRASGNDPAMPGTYLIRGDERWTDYRMTVIMRAVADEDAMGVVFRWKDRNNFYRFAWDARRSARRLTRHLNGHVRVLAEDEVSYQLDQDYEVTVEAVGSSLTVFVRGRQIFKATDASQPQGKIGLYSWAHTGARFSNIQLYDLRTVDEANPQQLPVSPSVFSFQFITSAYANFRHQIHSHDDRFWRQTVIDDSAIRAVLPASVIPSGNAGDAEIQAFESLQSSVFGNGPRELPDRTELTRIGTEAGADFAWFVELAEPIDWQRTSLAIQTSRRQIDPPRPASELKLIGVSLPTAGQASDPSNEFVDLLVRQPTELSDVKVEHLMRPGAISADWDDAVYFADAFRSAPRVVFFEESFGPNTLDHWQKFDLGDPRHGGDGAWKLDGRQIIQTSDYGGSEFRSDDPARPGTVLVTGRNNWGDVRLECELLSEDNDGLGVLFRFKSEDEYYRFAINREKQDEQLVRYRDGRAKVLWQRKQAYTSNQWYGLRIECIGNRLIGYFDDRQLFDLVDNDPIARGQVGLYSWYNQGSRFRLVRVESLPPDPILWEFGGTDPVFGAMTIQDEGNVNGPSQWSLADGVLSESSTIYSPADPEVRFGTYALLGSRNWTDYRVTVRVSSGDDDDVGFMFRYTGHDDYYRLAINRQIPYIRLTKFLGGTFSVIWEADWRYEYDREYELQVECRGNELKVYRDGVLLTSLDDAVDPHIRGQIALYSYAQTASRFHRVRVDSLDGTGPLFQDGFGDTVLDQLEIHDQGIVDAPSQWTLQPRAIVQTSTIHRVHPLFEPGTVAAFGDENWTDFEVRAVLESGGPGGLGLVFRYLDRDRFYRFAMFRVNGRPPEFQLIRMTPGSARRIWSNNVALQFDRAYEVVVRAEGSRFQGFVDGRRVFDVFDNTIAHGRVGLYSYANDAARFRQVQVFNRTRHIGAWQITDRGDSSAPSAWSIGDGQMLQRSLIRDSDPRWREAGTYALAGDVDWTDIRLSVTLQSHREDAIGVVFRYQNGHDFYRFAMDRSRPKRWLERCRDGIWTTIWQDNAPYEISTVYELTIDVVGQRMHGWLNGASVFDELDGAHASGRIGLFAAGNDFAVFHDVKIGRPPASAYRLFSDTFRSNNEIGSVNWQDILVHCRLGLFAGGGEIGLQVRRTSANRHYRIELNAQQGRRRLVRRTTAGADTILWEDIHNGLALDQFHDLIIVLRGSRIEGHLDGVPMFEVEDDQLDRGRIAPLGWGSPNAQFDFVHVYPDFFHLGARLFSETFAGRFEDRWQVHDTGNVGGSLWSFQDGQLWQSGNIWSAPLSADNTTTHGTMAVTGEESWTDYRFVAQIGTYGDDDEMGVVFRFIDRDNYYRFAMNRQFTYRRLVRCQNGVCNIIWHDNFAYQADRDYVVTVDAFGDSIRVFVDGELAADVHDNAHMRGRIGLHCWSNIGLRVRKISLQTGNWGLYHQFGHEPKHPDGTLIRLHSGPPNNESTPAGMVRRHRTREGETADSLLPVEGARLRLIGKGSAILSERTFLPTTTFADASFRVLRRADGTAFFLFLPDTSGGSQFSDPLLRLAMTYLRDAGVELPIYSQSGDQDPESVVIDAVRV